MGRAQAVNATAEGEVLEASLAAVVLRAVPCEEHDAYVLGCSNCLTGEQAFQQGVAQGQDDLGVIARTDWSGWRRSFQRWNARRRIHRANKKAGF